MIPEVSVRNAPPAAPAYEDDEVQALRKWGGVLAHGWGVLAIGAIAGALLGWLAAARTPPLFEATATVALNLPSEEPGGIFFGTGMRTVFTSPAVLAKVVGDLGLDRAPYSLTPGAFGARHLIVEDIPNTYVTRLRARLPDPQLAARAVTSLAQGAVDLTARIWRDRIAAEATTLEKQLPAARQQLARAEQDWLASRLAIDKGAARAERVRVPRGVAPDLSEDRSPPPNEKPLEDRLAQSRVQARGSEAIERVYAREFELVRLENEVEVRRKVYMDIAGRLEAARAELTATMSPLQLVEAAPVPQQPLPGTGKRTIALGFLAGLVLAACVVVAREWRMSHKLAR